MNPSAMSQIAVQKCQYEQMTSKGMLVLIQATFLAITYHVKRCIGVGNGGRIIPILNSVFDKLVVRIYWYHALPETQ